MKLMIGFALVACLLVVGCGRSSPTDTPTPTATPTREATAEATPTPRPDATATAESPAESGTTATATPVPAPPVSIDMVSTTLEVKPGQEFRVDVVVDPHGGGISGVQVQIEFDPAVLQAAGVQAGTLLGPDPAGPFAQELEPWRWHKRCAGADRVRPRGPSGCGRAGWDLTGSGPGGPVRPESWSRVSSSTLPPVKDRPRRQRRPPLSPP